MEVKGGKNPDPGRIGFLFNFKKKKFFFGGWRNWPGWGWERCHTDGKAKRRQQSLVQIELSRKRNLPDQFPTPKRKPLRVTQTPAM